MKRIANFRSGDRAENFGVTLMQMFCAMAPVPRPEDFGIVDAVATLLRRDGHLLYAEDSFTVQFKSRTERKIEYIDERFEALLNQELDIFIAQIDLSQADIKLYSVGAVLSHPNINDFKGIVLHLEPVSFQIDKNIMYVSAGNPILHWSAADLTNLDRELNAYQVMKKWLELNRWNRQYRKMGLQNQIHWQTNEVPTRGSSTVLWQTHHAEIALSAIIPTVQVLGTLGISEPEITEPVMRLISWMKSQGVDPDPAGTISLFIQSRIIHTLMNKELIDNDEADVVVFIEFSINEPGCYVFWEHIGGTDEPSWSAQKHQCSNLDELQAVGFEAEIDPQTQKVTTIKLGQSWLAHRHFEILDISNSVYILKKIVQKEPH